MFDPLFLFVSLVVGAVGTGAFMYGKRAHEPKYIVGGCALVGSCYFITSPLFLTLFALGVSFLLWGEALGLTSLGSGRKTRQIESVPRKY